MRRLSRRPLQERASAAEQRARADAEEAGGGGDGRANGRPSHGRLQGHRPPHEEGSYPVRLKPN